MAFLAQITQRTIKADWCIFEPQWRDVAPKTKTQDISQTMPAFLRTEGLPPYYTLLANLAMYNWAVVAMGMQAPYYYLLESEKALTAARKMYVHDLRDTTELDWLEKRVK